MKINWILFAVVIAFSLAAPLNEISAQCSDVLSEQELSDGYKYEDKPGLTEEEKKKLPSKPERVYSAIKVVTKDTRFKIALDTEVSAGFAKPNDAVPFTVLENVYVNVKVPDIPDIKDKPDINKKLVEKRCVLVPKGTKVYGMVDKSKSPYPLYLRGKSRLGVLVHELRIESAESIYDKQPLNISFAEPLAPGPARNPQKPQIRDCRIYTTRKCVVGRRPKLTLPPNVITPFAEGYLFAQDDDNGDWLGVVAATKALGDLSGLNDLVNPPKANLREGMIFDVIVTGGQTVWVAAGASAKKDEDK